MNIQKECTFHCLAFSSSMMFAISGSITSSGAFNCLVHCKIINWDMYQYKNVVAGSNTLTDIKNSQPKLSNLDDKKVI